MIELKNLNKKVAYDLVRGCEITTFKTQNMKWQRPVINKLVNQYGKRYKTSIQLIITLACKAKRYDLTGCMIPLDSNVYALVNKKRPTNKLSRKYIRELIDLLDADGYLTFYKGYFNNKDDCMVSCIRFHNKLLDNLNKSNCDKWGVSRLDDFVLVEVIDSSKSTDSKDVLKDNKHIRGIREISDNVLMVNKEIESHLITYKGETCVVVYKRRFEDDLQSGGRWYIVGTFQTEDSDYRYTIMIDSTPTVEIDIDHIHPAILASIAGYKLPVDYDPYDIKSYVHTPLDTKVLRDFIKPCFMALLYAQSRHTALYEIRKKLWDNPHISNWLDAETILESLEEHNHMLAEFFYKKDNWKLCQFIDSSIATKIMTHFASKGEVCLNYHDSWIVTYNNKQELIDVMTKSWETVIGDLTNFSYSVEFDNTPTQPNVHPAFEEIPVEYYEE